ncbi:response regulator [Orrella sp. JC864]|uniref:response regulator n=1 Tax=Orrella sp. JC864 TaxID=3120298 RepID=UPI003009042B
MLVQSKRITAIHVAIVLITAAVFLTDTLTRLGIQVWVFYIIPLALTSMQSNRNLPVGLALVQASLMAAGYVLGMREGQALPLVPAMNRSFGILTIIGVAYMARQVIVERNRIARILWLQEGENAVGTSLFGEQKVEEIGNNALQALARYTDAQVGVLHRVDRKGLQAIGHYGCTPDEARGAVGLTAEVARQPTPIVVTDLPEDYLRASSAVGSAKVGSLLIAPILSEGRLAGVIELGYLRPRGRFEDELELIRQVSENVATSLRSAAYREHLKELLEETQRQSEELQAQQEELRVSNEELEEQSRVLRESQARLENQQAELEQTNVQLEEQTQRLERQKRELLDAQRALEINASELSRANRYKSEFLANMSHELRTPLNSSLILSQILSEPRAAELPPEQARKYAKTIHDANNDLLALINDILDLSKIEVGHVEIDPAPATIAGLIEPVKQQFEPIAAEKQVAFEVHIQPGTPASLVTDHVRLQQVLKNLLSNAFKFTDRGSVRLEVSRSAGDRVAFAVRDTGIGIPPAQQDVIFEAFRQADGTTSRKYGGTGLGLSISRELTRLLGGEIHVESAPGVGSTFTAEVAIDLNTVARAPRQDEVPAVQAAEPAGRPSRAAAGARPAARQAGAAPAGPAPGQPHAPATIDDDRGRRHRDRLILVVEDDEHFASVLYELAHELGFDCIHASSGEQAIRLARENQPHGILLDVGLPDQSGLSILEQLKRDPATRHVPIHVLSVSDHTQTALELGAVGYALKPVAREELVSAFRKVEEKLQARPRRILVVEDDATLRENIGLLLQADDIEITTAGTVAEALHHVAANTFDCMVMDLMLPDASGYELLEQMAAGQKYSFPPVIVYTGRHLTRAEEQKLRRYSKSIIIKGAKSPERLLDEVTLFLHRVESSLPADQRQLLQQARQRDTVFENRRILLVEDDVRNIFALSSILEPLGAKLVIARNGREALEQVEKDPDLDLVLMDLMMPEMDGLTATRAMRRRPELSKLPIIALTAKAMPDDRRSCLEAGANDYIAKPIDVDKLVSLCRVWMPK